VLRQASLGNHRTQEVGISIYIVRCGSLTLGVLANSTPSAGIFGSSPAGGLFGSGTTGNQQSGGGFGGGSTTNALSGTGGGIFGGGSNAGTGSGIFGSGTTSAPPNSNTLFSGGPSTTNTPFGGGTSTPTGGSTSAFGSGAGKPGDPGYQATTSAPKPAKPTCMSVPQRNLI
jgi:hypothetical protein